MMLEEPFVSKKTVPGGSPKEVVDVVDGVDMMIRILSSTRYLYTAGEIASPRFSAECVVQ